MQSPFRTLNTLSNWVIGFAWVGALGGVIGGIVLAVQTDGSYFEPSHPYVGLGLAVIFASIVQAVVITWMAYLGKAVSAMGDGVDAVRRQTYRPAAVAAADRAPLVATASRPPVATADKSRSSRRWIDAEFFRGPAPSPDSPPG
jgi:hypothetical protein